MAYSRSDLAKDLRDLSNRRVVQKSDLDDWYQEARRVQEALVTLSLGDENLPHFELIMHWLIDADIRLKDPRYAALQNEALRVALAELEA